METNMKAIFEKWLFDPTVSKIVISLLIIICIQILSMAVKRVIVKHVQHNQLKYNIKKLISLSSYLLIIFGLSIVFSKKLGGLTVAFGVAGAGIAFALQEVIASVAGWIALSFGNFYKVGDRVEIGGIKGDVIDIGIIRTTLMECGGWVKGDLYTGRIVRVANSYIFKDPVFNYSGDFPFLWDEIIIPIKYGSDYKMAKQLLTNSLESITGEYSKQAENIWAQMNQRYLIEKARVKPMVTLLVTDNWAEYTLRYIVDYKMRRVTKDLICESILKFVQDSNGQVMLGSTTIEITSLPNINIKNSL
jgi:small-conductance mechanosensitive channel